MTERVGEKKQSVASPGNTVLSAITENTSVVSGNSKSYGKKSIKSSMGSVLRKATSPGSIKTEQASVIENKGSVASPMSIKTEKVSVTENIEAVNSPMSIKTEKAPVESMLNSVSSMACTTMSIKTEKASVKTGSITVNDIPKVASGKSNAKRPAGALPKKPSPTKHSSKGTRNSTLPPSLGIPELTKTSSLSLRAESPPTPLTSNLTTSRRLNTVRSMSPSMERHIMTSMSRSPPKKEEDSNKSFKNDASVDNIGSAVIITELLSATNGVNSSPDETPDNGAKIEETNVSEETKTKVSIDNARNPKGEAGVTRKETKAAGFSVEQKVNTEKESSHEDETVEKETMSTGTAKTKTTIVYETETTTDNGQEVVMSPVMAKKMNEMASIRNKTKTTLIQKARSFGSRSVSSKNSKQEIKSTSSKDISNSSKNPASDGSTAASSTVSGSSGSIGSDENKSQGDISKTVTESTQKASNVVVANKPAVTMKLSNCAPQKAKSSIKTVRLMSPAVSLRNKFLPARQPAEKNEVELETISSVALKDKSLPKQVVSSTLEGNDAKSEADNVSVEVVACVDDSDALIEKSNSSDSDVKRRQKVKRLLKSRQKLRSNASSSSSPTASMLESCDGSEGKDSEVPNLQSEPTKPPESASNSQDKRSRELITTAAKCISESAQVKSISLQGINGGGERNDDEIPALGSIASEKISSQASCIQKPLTNASDSQGKSSLKLIATVAASESVSAEVKSMPALTAAPIKAQNENTSKTPVAIKKSANDIGKIDIHNDPNDHIPPPIRLIDCKHDAHADDELTLDPDLCDNRQKTQLA